MQTIIALAVHSLTALANAAHAAFAALSCGFSALLATAAPFIEFGSDGVAIFGYTIYYYALVIVSGMVLAIILMSRLLPKQGLLSDSCLDYAVVTLPSAIIGARLYFLLFPYNDITYAQFSQSWTWSNFWAIRNGGLAVYGGVILGYLAVYLMSRRKKQNFYEVADCIIPGLLLAQSLGRWGNFINHEAFGNLVTNPALQWFPYAVQVGGQFYQATFFYESVLTLCGALICLWLINKKFYRRGLLLAFYGIYYGIVRLLIESLRTDSLFLRVPIFWKQEFWNTHIKISQAVSVICIVLGIIRIVLMYRREIAALFRKKSPPTTANP